MRERFGLHWTQSTVTAVETGRRELTLEEFVALASATGMPAHEWFPGNQWVLISGEPAITPAYITERGLRILFGGAEGDLEREWDAPTARKPTEVSYKEVDDLANALTGGLVDEAAEEDFEQHVATIEAAFLDAQNEAERKAARALTQRLEDHLWRKLNGYDIAFLAHRVWGRSLTAERDARLAETTTGNESARRLQAKRGHITRALVKELEQLISSRLTQAEEREKADE